MGRSSRDGFFRRIGRALRGVNAIEYGRPVPADDLEPGSPNQLTTALTADEPPRPAGDRTRGA